jgi:hypothetical protein
MKAVAESSAASVTAKRKAACVQEDTIKPMTPAQKRAAMRRTDPITDRKADTLANRLKNRPNLKPETLGAEVAKVITSVGKRPADVPEMTALVNDKLKAMGVIREGEEDSIVERLRSVLMDLLTPLSVNKVKSISIDSIIEKLRLEKTGVDLNRQLIMKLIDPRKNSMITRIEGDTVFFRVPLSGNAKSEDEAQKDLKAVTSKAVKQAKASLSKRR